MGGSGNRATPPLLQLCRVKVGGEVLLKTGDPGLFLPGKESQVVLRLYTPESRLSRDCCHTLYGDFGVSGSILLDTLRIGEVGGGEPLPPFKGGGEGSVVGGLESESSDDLVEFGYDSACSENLRGKNPQNPAGT